MKLDEINAMLSREGFQTTLDEEGSVISFKFEGGNFILHLDQEDSDYVRIMFPGFWEFSDVERANLSVIAHDCTRDLKAAKVVLMERDVWVSVEFWVTTVEELSRVYVRCLDAAKEMARTFVNKVRESKQSDARKSAS